MGHYAIHYDHLDPMSADYDEGWFEYYGNRLATALLIVDVAERGGGTLFPRLNLTIQPEEGGDFMIDQGVETTLLYYIFNFLF